MSGSNLPPGCRVIDIPGNRPEELAEEARWDLIYKDHPWFEGLSNGDPPDTGDLEGHTPSWYIKLHDMIGKLADYTYQQGIKVGEQNAADAAADREAGAQNEREQILAFTPDHVLNVVSTMLDRELSIQAQEAIELCLWLGQVAPVRSLAATLKFLERHDVLVKNAGDTYRFSAQVIDALLSGSQSS